LAYRIYIDESGTHRGSEWLLIGMLFVPRHAELHKALCVVKDREEYLNNSPKRNARYKAIHFKDVGSPRDVRVCKGWIDAFLAHPAFFRALAFDWTMWDGRYFGDAFDSDALKKRRAYKKWCELLLQPELSDPPDGMKIVNAELFLDRLRIAYEYDVIDVLAERFAPSDGYLGETPYIARLEHAASWRDSHQCLQLADMLLGALKEAFCPTHGKHKREVSDYLADKLAEHGVARLDPGFWKQYHPISLRERLPKLSAWCWQPERKRNRARKRR
jgi:Protein of unknown function (DUF3800)